MSLWRVTTTIEDEFMDVFEAPTKAEAERLAIEQTRHYLGGDGSLIIVAEAREIP